VQMCVYMLITRCTSRKFSCQNQQRWKLLSIQWFWRRNDHIYMQHKLTMHVWNELFLMPISEIFQSVELFVCFVNHCLSFCYISLCHCIICPSVYNGIWLPRWKLLSIQWFWRRNDHIYMQHKLTMHVWWRCYFS
jgi:hypothetical protein